MQRKYSSAGRIVRAIFVQDCGALEKDVPCGDRKTHAMLWMEAFAVAVSSWLTAGGYEECRSESHEMFPCPLVRPPTRDEECCTALGEPSVASSGWCLTRLVTMCEHAFALEQPGG